jgi:hypothetical protein
MVKAPGLGILLLALMVAACQPAATPVPTSASPTAVPTETATTTLTPSPVPPSPTTTLTPEPPSRLFTENFDAMPLNWSFLEVNAGQTQGLPQITGGSLQFDLGTRNQWMYGIYDPYEYADVRVDAAVQVRGGEYATPGVVCRYDKQKGWYELDVLEGQTYVLLFGQWLADGVARYTPLVRAQSEKIQAGANEIGLVCEGDTLTPFINGTQLRRRQETLFGLSSGRVGVAASAFEQVPAVVAYDWVQVSEP